MLVCQLIIRMRQEVRLAALIELRGLRLAVLQRKVRADVAAAGGTLAGAKPDALLEWRRWRRAAPDPWDLGAAVAAAAAAAAPAVDHAEMARWVMHVNIVDACMLAEQ